MTIPTQSSGSTTSSASSTEGSAEMQRIAQVEDKLLRNALVTHSYHELSQRLRTALRRDDANWATFATWTSRAAGNFMRGDRIPTLVHSILQSAQRSEGARISASPALPKRKVGLLSGRVLESVADVIADANWEIYDELAPLLDTFATWMGGLTRPDDAGLARFTGRLQASPSRNGGQDLLAHALRNYHRARFAREPGESAERILHANILVAWHEQLRLRPKVLLLLEAPVADVLRVTEIGAGLRLNETWRYLVTRTMLTSYVPEGRRLPPGPRAHRCFANCALPRDALELEYDPLDAVMATTRERERELASSFADLRERMRQTALWYWENQQTEALLRPPFVGRKQARLMGLAQEGAGGASHSHAARIGSPRPGARRPEASPASRRWNPWSPASSHDPAMEAALALSAPRTANSVSPRDRRVG